MRGAVGVNAERNAHLSEKEFRFFPFHTAVGVKHFDCAFVREVNLRFVDDVVRHLSVQSQSCGAHLKATFALFGLAFNLCSNRSAEIGEPVGQSSVGGGSAVFRFRVKSGGREQGQGGEKETARKLFQVHIYYINVWSELFALNQ